MGDFSTFFKGSDNSLGVFYPKNYIIATFHRYSAATSALHALLRSGIAKDEAMVATGDEVLEYFKHFREDAGLWGIVMRPISRFFATEVVYADHDILHASEGAGFIAVHSATEEQTKRIMDVMKDFSPSSAEWYLFGGIRSLVSAEAE